MAKEYLAWVGECCGAPAYADLWPAVQGTFGRTSQICRVTCREPPDRAGTCISKSAKWCYDATPVYREFARRHALRVAHLWNAPPVVVQYLKTGNESIRAAAAYAAERTRAAWDYSAPYNQAMEASSAALTSATYASGMRAARFIAWDAWDAGREAHAAAAWASGAVSAFSPRERQVGATPSDHKALGHELAQMLTRGRGIYGQRSVP